MSEAIDRIRKISATAWRWIRAPLAMLVAVGGLGGLAWWLATVPDDKLFKDRIDVMIKVTAGVAAAIGLFVAWRRSEAALKQAETAARQVETVEQGQITERFTKAISQLGDDKLAVRLGGIYALERIALDSERDHWTVMEVFCAYIRENRPLEQVEVKMVDLPEWLIQPEPLPVDIQSIMTVLARRKSAQENVNQGLDLSRTNLSGACLGRADLAGADLSSANLTGADLKATDLSSANLSNAELSGANLTSANLTGTNLMALLPYANLAGANLTGAILSSAYGPRANLCGVNLTDANLDRADLSGANLSGANLETTDLSGANLSGTNLFRACLTQSQLDSANGDETANLPRRLTMPDHWKRGDKAKHQPNAQPGRKSSQRRPP